MASTIGPQHTLLSCKKFSTGVIENHSHSLQVGLPEEEDEEWLYYPTSGEKIIVYKKGLQSLENTKNSNV